MTEEVRQALQICPQELRRQVMEFPLPKPLEEVRLRLGRPVQLYTEDGETVLPKQRVTRELLQQVLSLATEHSIYAAQATMCQGYLTVTGGHRLGLCGLGVQKEGQITALRELSSMNLRIARQIIGCGEQAADWLWIRPRSTLLIGPPARGKTTLLRDLIRLLSDRFGWRICVVDERRELGCCVNGLPQFDLGAHTDILTGIGKAQGIEMLLRTMNPQWIALDEITATADIEAIVRASYCGVSFLATAHAAAMAELRSRPIYRQLLEAQVFENIITILPDRSLRMERVQLCSK